MSDNRREIPPVSLIEQTDRNAAPHVWLQNSMVCAPRYPLRRNNHFARTEITGQKSGANVRSPHSTEPFGLRSGNDRIGARPCEKAIAANHWAISCRCMGLQQGKDFAHATRRAIGLLALIRVRTFHTASGMGRHCYRRRRRSGVGRDSSSASGIKRQIFTTRCSRLLKRNEPGFGRALSCQIDAKAVFRAAGVRRAFRLQRYSGGSGDSRSPRQRFGAPRPASGAAAHAYTVSVSDSVESGHSRDGQQAGGFDPKWKFAPPPLRAQQPKCTTGISTLRPCSRPTF
jgi:hypothetical protein